MIGWLSAVPAILIAVAFVTVPGALAAWCLRFRGLTLLAASIAASIAIIAVASVISPFVGLSWGIVPVLSAAIAVTVALWPVRKLTRPHGAPPIAFNRRGMWTLVALATAGALIGLESARAIGSPENFSQTYDGVFHLNAAAHILLTGDASPFHMDIAAPGSGPGFYPTVWHSLVALVSQASGTSVPLATNAVTLAVAAWIWPVAILFFGRPFFARRPVHLIIGAILAANFSAFPYLLMAWGVLYPNLLSTALIPLALGFIYSALRHRVVAPRIPLVSKWIAALGAIGAASLAHPNAVFGIAVFTVPMLIVVANDARRLPLSRTAKFSRWAGITATFCVIFVTWWSVSTNDNTRSYGEGPIAAFVSGISNAPMIGTRAWFLTVLVLGGAVTLLVLRRHRWILFAYAFSLGLFVVAAGLQGPARDAFTGAWYNDAHRIAALLPIAAIPLAALCASHVFDFVVEGLTKVDPHRVPKRTRKLLPAIGAVVVAALVLTGARGQNIALQSGWISELFRSDGALLSDDERTLLERIPDEVPADALIAGDPWTGAGLALAISNRNVVFAHLNGRYNAETAELGTDFNKLGTQACPLLTDLGVAYLLDFGGERYDIGDDSRYEPYLGLHNIEKSPVVTEIDREGAAALFAVNCN